MSLDTIPLCICQHDPAVVQVYLNQGCVAYKTDHIQNLCLQHYLSVQPRDEMKLTKIWDIVAFAWFWSTRGVEVDWSKYKGLYESSSSV